MDRKSWVTLTLCLIGGGIGGYGAFTNTGPVGWLNMAQQRVFGSYYPLMSFLVVMTAIMGGGALLWDLVQTKLLKREPEGVLKQVLLGPERLPPGASAGVSDKTVLLIYAAFLGITWAAGGTYYFWNSWSLREDAAAIYERVELTDGQPLPAKLGSHIELRGIPLTEAMVVFKSRGGSSSSERDRLVALVGVGWKPDHPVPFVLKLESLKELPQPPKAGGWTARNPREVRVLVRRQGSVPVPALAVFREMHAPLAPDVVTVHLVETRDGKPFLPDDSSDWTIVLVCCGGLSLLLIVFFFVTLHSARKYRKSLETPV